MGAAAAAPGQPGGAPRALAAQRLAAACVLVAAGSVPRASATLCVGHNVLELYVLEARRHIVKDALPEELRRGGRERSLEELAYNECSKVITVY